MEILNTLASLVYYSFANPTVSGLTKIVTSLITLFSSIGIGVIVFTLVLKLLTFPLDYFSRASMRKNSLKMEEMRPELEKLQKQYANEKEKYNQKMMALYKKNGYSAFGSCLPTIVSLVLFMVVLSSFNSYSNYQNIKYLYNMNTAFNNVVDYGVLDDGKYILRNKDGSLDIKDSEIYALKTGDKVVIDKITATYSVETKTDDKGAVETHNFVVYQTEGGYVSVKKEITIDKDGKTVFSDFGYNLVVDNLEKNTTLKNEKGETFAEYFLTQDETKEEAGEAFILDVQKTASAEKYREEQESFLWVKNIWMTDTPMAHPVYKDYATFNKTYKLSKYTSDANQYANLTEKLVKEKSQPNGYFILVALTALSSLAMQLIMNKSQKAQLELQSVNGQAQQTQKIMMWMMPIMMAVFAFMYTAAFSLYIIMSSVFSTLSTLFINKMVDIQIARQKKKAAKGTVVVNNRSRRK